MFIWLYSIMLPVFLSTGNADLAFKTGVLAHLVGGIVFIIGAFVVPLVLKIVPAGALFGSLAGGAMAFLIMQSMNGVLKMPLVGLAFPDRAVCDLPGKGGDQAARGSHRHCGGFRRGLDQRRHGLWRGAGIFEQPELLHTPPHSGHL